MNGRERKPAFTKGDGNRLIAILLGAWAVCLGAALAISSTTDHSTLYWFMVMFGICIAVAVLHRLLRKDLLSSLLLIGGALIAFAITVKVMELLGVPV